MSNTSPIILIHGAWHGSWCWQKIIPLLLEQQGRIVLAPNLPGHQPNDRSDQKITLQSYINCIVSIIDQQSQPVMLVGHSMAGMLIAQVAELRPQLIGKLIFLNAYLPSNEDSVFSLNKSFNPDGEINRAMHLSNNRRSYSIEESEFTRLFYHQSCKEDQELALLNYCPQPSLPLASSLKLSAENYGKLEKIAICSTDDRVIPAKMQKQMLMKQTCNEYIQIEGDHSPFFSLPDTLASLLLAQ